MKSILVFACLVAAGAQNLPPAASAGPPPAMPDLPDQTVIATFEDGAKMTMGEFKQLYGVLPPQNQQMILRDRANFLKQWAFMRKLAMMAEKEKLDQESPSKEALQYYRFMILSQAKLNAASNSIVVEPADIVKHYDLNRDKYKSVRVKAIYIPFTTDGKKGLSEEQARSRANKILSEIRGGADFVKLVKEHSQDETSRAKDGDFAVLRPNDNIPDAIRSAVFALKKGEVSEPVRQPNGFYLLKAEDVTYRPLSQARDEIVNEVRQQRYAQWLEQMNRDTKVVFNSPEFAGQTPAKQP